MSTLSPERPYSSFQRREIIIRIAEKNGIDLIDATTQFNAMEMADPEALAKLAATLPEGPKDSDSPDDKITE